MSEEEAVQILELIANMKTENGFAYGQKNTICLQESIRVLLQSREKDKAEIETAKQKEKFYNKLSEDNKYYSDCYEILRKQYIQTKKSLKGIINKQNIELEKKDKIIDEMAKTMSRNMSCDFIRTTDEKCANIDCEKCFKEYFENKVEEDKDENI